MKDNRNKAMNKAMNNTKIKTKIKGPRKDYGPLKEKARKREVIRVFLGQYKTNKEILEGLKVQYAEVTARLNTSKKHKEKRSSSKDLTHNTSEKGTIMDEKAALEKQMKELEKNIVYADYILSRISERQRHITEAFLFSDSPMGVAKELAKQYMYSRCRIHQLHNEALMLIYTEMDRIGFFRKGNICNACDVASEANTITSK
jgi:DNA-directed RNA polymerase specialized sigma subunit